MKYPQHEKLRGLESESLILSEFIDWLRYEKNYTICEMFKDDYYGLSGYPIKQNNDYLIGEFLGIDQNELEKEKKEMLKEVQEMQERL